MSWPVRNFSEAISSSGIFTDGDWVESKDQDPRGDVRLIQLADIGVGKFIDKSDRFMSSAKAKELRCTFLEAGDILIARMPDPIGRACIFPENMGKCVTVVDVCVVRPDSDYIDTKWLMHQINSEKFKNQINQHVTGTTRQRISRGNLAMLEISVPPLAEQKRIATILDKADAIRRKRQQAIQLADNFLRATFLDMFGDPATNPKGWEVITVAECLKKNIILQVQDGNHGNYHPKVTDFVPDGIPFVTANVVRRGKILFQQCYFLGNEWLDKLRIGFAKPRDVLISHKGSLGFTAVLDDSFDNYIFSPQTTYYRVDENRLIPEYLKAYFDTGYFQRLFVKEGIQSTRAYLGITRQKNLPIVLPSIEMQRKFVAVLNQFTKVVERQVKTNNQLPYCFKSLSQKAFNGELN